MKTTRLSILLLFAAFWISGSISAQEKTYPSSFTIIGENDQQKLDFYSESILNASMENYRLLDTDLTLKFKEGFECIMFSAKKVAASGGSNINLSNYLETFPSKYILPVFSITQDGKILGEVNRNEKASK
jgi:hypothetical protein